MRLHHGEHFSARNFLTVRVAEGVGDAGARCSNRRVSRLFKNPRARDIPGVRQDQYLWAAVEFEKLAPEFRLSPLRHIRAVLYTEWTAKSASVPPFENHKW